MNWQEVLQGNHETVIIQSYGYIERSSYSSHFEPFKHKRDFIFNINRVQFEGEELSGFLEHKWLFLEDPEEELTFEEKDGEIILDDPDLWARPQDCCAILRLNNSLFTLQKSSGHFPISI